jgi:hypothetical protein
MLDAERCFNRTVGRILLVSETRATDYAQLAGYRFPGATFTLPEYVAWLWEDAILAEHDASVAHPSLAFFIAMQGTGVDIADVMALLDAPPDSGVMFGENELEFNGALRPGGTYVCDAEILAVERKTGKRAGVFDRLTFTVRLRETAGSEPVATSTSTWIFPRSEPDDG